MQSSTLFLVECVFCFLLLFVSLPVDGDLTDPSLLPFLPTEEQLTARLDPQLLAIANGGRKGGKIPRIIWVAVANASEPLPGSNLRAPYLSYLFPFISHLPFLSQCPIMHDVLSFSSSHYFAPFSSFTPGPFLNFIQRNTGWLLQVKGNREKDVFIDTVFSGTSIQVCD